MVSRSSRRYRDESDSVADSAENLEIQRKRARRIQKFMNCVNTLFIVLLIVGTLLAAAITFVFKPGSRDSTEYKGKIVYFAISPGDGDLKAEANNHSDSVTNCSFSLNVDQISRSIRDAEQPTQRYSFITFDESIDVTSPLEAEQAIGKLNDIPPSREKRFNQTAVIAKFTSLVQNKKEDLLVHFIPCRYQYNQGGDDTTTFVEGLKKIPGRVLLVSNIAPQSTIAKAFNLTKEYVVGSGDDVSKRIKNFCTNTVTTKAPLKTSQSVPATSSPPRTRAPPVYTTSAPSVNKTTVSRSTDVHSSGEPATPLVKSTAYTALTHVTASSPITELMSTFKPITESTILASTTTPNTNTTIGVTTNTTSTTTTAITTTTATTLTTTTAFVTTISEEPIDEVEGVHCLFAGDLLNFGRDEDAIKKEREFIRRIAVELYNMVPNATAGIWAYGYTPKEEIKINSKMMYDNIADFWGAIKGKMMQQGQRPDISRNDMAVLYVNAAEDKDQLANCVVFLSAVEKNRLNELENVKLNITTYANIHRVVAVSLRSLDLSNIVIPPDGKAVKVSQEYTTQDVNTVIRAITKNFPE